MCYEKFCIVQKFITKWKHFKGCESCSTTTTRLRPGILKTESHLARSISSKILLMSCIESLPCTVNFDGDADVESKFIIQSESNEQNVAYFRGRRLVSTNVNVQSLALTGVVIQNERPESNTKQPQQFHEKRQIFAPNFKIAGTIDEIRMWHHDFVEKSEIDAVSLAADFIAFSDWLSVQ